MGLITYNGTCSDVFGVFSQAEPEYQYPDRDHTLVHIPGMNGDLYFDNGCYMNVDRKYNIALDLRALKSTEIFSKIVGWLHSASGYARLEDTYEPDFFRKAMYVETGSLQNIYDQGGAAVITFNCKPQRFLKVGELPFILSSSTTILNPTVYKSEPLIKITGSGDCTFTIGSASIAIDDLDDFIYLDSETQNAYRGTTNLNDTVHGEYPTFVGGSNLVGWTGNITSVEITPRWWTL